MGLSDNSADVNYIDRITRFFNFVNVTFALQKLHKTQTKTNINAKISLDKKNQLKVQIGEQWIDKLTQQRDHHS